MKITINDDEVGNITNQHFLNVKAAPGNYTVTVDWFSDVYSGMDKPLTQFDITVTPNSLGIIGCWYGPYTSLGKGQSFITEKKNCANGTMKNTGGISHCEVSGKIVYTPSTIPIEPDIASYADGMNCKLTTDKGYVRSAKMVAGNISTISNDGDAEFATAQAAGTSAAYQSFIKEYPASKHTVTATKEYDRLVVAEATNAKEAKIRTKLARDQALPLDVKKDKYILTLTKHLNLQQYEESLFYFELLERLNVELPPSFNYFWGEALLRTNQPNAAIDKLYQYINQAGSQGKYYTKALELTNEAEAQL